MAKYIKNATKGVISLGEKNFIPGGDPVAVTDGELAHPTIAAFIKASKLEVIEIDTSKKTKNAAKALEEMSLDELKAYAIEKKIDLGDAADQEGILAIIKKAGE